VRFSASIVIVESPLVAQVHSAGGRPFDEESRAGQSRQAEVSPPEEDEVHGIRHVLRNFTATAVKEHLRSQLEDTGGAPNLTDKEVELVRYIRDESVKLDVIIAPGTDGS
jgi:hypothetical protein